MKRTLLFLSALLFIVGPSLFAQPTQRQPYRQPAGPDPREAKRQEQIRDTGRELRQVREELAQAREELASLRHRRNNLEKAMPKSPPRTSRRDRIIFEKKTEEWRREMDSLDAKIHRQKDQVNRLEDKERDLSQRLARLEDEQRKSQKEPPPRRRR